MLVLNLLKVGAYPAIGEAVILRVGFLAGIFSLMLDFYSAVFLELHFVFCSPY